MDSLLLKLDLSVSLQHPYVRHEANASAFADDLKFIVNLARNHLDFTQANINWIFDWSVSRGMPLCLDKCIVLHCGKSHPHHCYQYGNSFLPAATSFRDLGVIRSSDDTYTEHVFKVAQRGRQLIGQCFRAFQSRDPRFLVRVYCTYVLPILNYGSPVWSPHLRQEVNELKSAQRRFTRRLAGLRGYSYGERLRNLSLLSLESQRQMADYLTIYKIIHKQMGISLQDAGLNLSTINTREGGSPVAST